MLKDVLTKTEKIALVPKYENWLSGFARIANKIHKRKQHPFAKILKDAGFSYIECKK